jgi:hypothetical protein
MSLTTPSSVRELQIALYVKAKANPTYRFYALYDKTYREDVLLRAWGCCRANGGSAGVDGESFAKIQARGVDRVAQMAAVIVLEAIFEADLTEEQYAYRPKRSAHGAVREVHQLLRRG